MDKMKLIDVDEARVLWELGVDVYIKERDRSYSRLPSEETPAPVFKPTPELTLRLLWLGGRRGLTWR